MPGQEVRGEIGNVTLAFPQRRKLDREQAQAIEQIWPEFALAHKLAQVGVGGRDEPHVRPLFAARSERAKRLVLKHSEQRHLCARAERVDLVEEQRPPVALEQEALPAFVRVGERAPLVAEQLVFEQRVPHEPAVQRDERERCAIAEVMNGSGDELLPGPGLAADQHGALAACDVGQVGDDLRETWRIADELGQTSNVAQAADDGVACTLTQCRSLSWAVGGMAAADPRLMLVEEAR